MKPFEPKYPMTPWNDKELEYMKKLALADKDMGYALTDGPQAVAWYDFYMARQPKKAKILYETLAAGKAYMVPAELPHYYEIGWGPKENPKQKLLPDAISSKTPEEREAFVENILRNVLKRKEEPKTAPAEPVEDLDTKLKRLMTEASEALKSPSDRLRKAIERDRDDFRW